MRVLGDKYIMSEFRAHRNIDNPVHIVGFLMEWQTYAQQIEGKSWRGEKMDKNKIDKMSGMFVRFRCEECTFRTLELTCDQISRLGRCTS